MLHYRARFVPPLACSICMLLLTTLAAASNPDVIKASHHDRSPAFSQLATMPSAHKGGNSGQTNSARPTRAPLNNASSDPVASPFTSPAANVTAGVSFEGQSANDTRSLLGFAFVPPDTNGAVSSKQYVQVVNVTVSVYDKSGNVQ